MAMNDAKLDVSDISKKLENHLLETMCERDVFSIDCDEMKLFFTRLLEKEYGEGNVFVKVDEEKNLITVDFRPMINYIDVTIDISRGIEDETN